MITLNLTGQVLVTEGVITTNHPLLLQNNALIKFENIMAVIITARLVVVGARYTTILLGMCSVCLGTIKDCCMLFGLTFLCMHTIPGLLVSIIMRAQ